MSVVQVERPSLYGRITADLLARIAGGVLQPGDALPSEGAMCREYGVSRITVRRAVAELVARSLLVRRAGVGSFVAGRPGRLREFHLTGFLDDKRDHESTALLNRTVRADAAVAAALGLDPGAAVRHIRTLVRRDGLPMTVADAYTPDEPDRRARDTDYRSPLPAVAAMGLRLGRRVTRAEQAMDAVAADAAVSRHLGLARGTPVMRTRRTYFSAGNVPLELLVVRYHPDRYVFTAELLPRGGTAAYATQDGAVADAPAGPAPATRTRGRPRRSEIT